MSHYSEGRDSPGLSAVNQDPRGNPIDISNGQQLPEAYKLQLSYDNKDKRSGDLKLSDNKSLMAEPMKQLQETLDKADQLEREAEMNKSDPKKLMAMEDLDKHKSDPNKLMAMEDFDKGSKIPDVGTPAGNYRSDPSKLAKMLGFDRASKMNETEYTAPEANQNGILDQQEPQLKDNVDLNEKMSVNDDNMLLSDNVDTMVSAMNHCEVVDLENVPSEENFNTDVPESAEQGEQLHDKPDAKKKMTNFFDIYANALTWTRPSANDEDDDDSDPDYVNIESTYNPDIKPFEFMNNGDDEYDSADTIINQEGVEMEPCATLCDSVSEIIYDEVLQPNATCQLSEGQEDSWPLQTEEVLLST